MGKKTESKLVFSTKANVKIENNRATNETNTFRTPITLCALFLGILVFLVYANSLQNGYVYDDIIAINNNKIIKKGISAIPEILSTPYQHGYTENGIELDALYRPLSLIMFAIEWQFFPANPVVGHFFNILIYAGCVVLLYLFLFHLFKKNHPHIAFIAALLFALHPIHTEVVANIKSRDELLCFFFSFLSLYIYIYIT